VDNNLSRWVFQGTASLKALVPLCSIPLSNCSQFNLPAHWIEIFKLVAVFASQAVLAAFNNPFLSRAIPASKRSTIDIERPTGWTLKCKTLAHFFCSFSCYAAQPNQNILRSNAKTVFEIFQLMTSLLLSKNSRTGHCTATKLVRTLFGRGC
jgi:hypothetical protein